MDDIAPLDVRLQRLPDTRNKLRELNQRWNNRLVLEGLSFPEAYLDGRFAIALVVEVCGAATAGRHAIREEEQEGWRHRDSSGRVVFVINANDLDFRHGDGCDQQPVFIDTIQMVKPNKLATIRAYEISNDLRDVGGDSLYFSVTRLRHQRLPILIYREACGFGVIPKRTQDRDGHIIQGCSQVVGGITNDRGEGVGFNRWRDDIKTRLSGLRVSVYPNTVRASIEISGNPEFQISDVLVGPFNL